MDAVAIRSKEAIQSFDTELHGHLKPYSSAHKRRERRKNDITDDTVDGWKDGTGIQSKVEARTKTSDCYYGKKVKKRGFFRA